MYRWLVVFVALAGCGPSLNHTSVTCSPGRTLLDGVCVSETVADYVACVRAQGAQLGATQRQALSADVGYLGARAGGAAELSETLEKKYAVSETATLQIIQACNDRASLVGGPVQTAAAPQAPPSPTPPRDSCECLEWASVPFSFTQGGTVTCSSGAGCASRYDLSSNHCADPLGDGYAWC